ncbi:hypothetical protein BpHYR1_035294 [Brachionus plicatilis]|uniref:Uncharacterized protein n=1 Tax=Brachionus plicatilis TaxID=10195 RepID=A0A3M7RU10_BRAPC|nr:hypothetical protein BpHYR1_035294 [Brachionus plicatilis]
MDLPIESNRKRGAPKKNASCLQRQKNETNASNEPAKGIESDNEDDESEIAPQPSKRIRVDETKKHCRVCNSELRMKEFFLIKYLLFYIKNICQKKMTSLDLFQKLKNYNSGLLLVQILY